MTYKLPNGQLVDLKKIRSVSTVRDLGTDPKTIDLNRLGFTIHLLNREILEVTEIYHYSDWGDVKRNLQKLRQELVDKWHEDTKD
ncbi:MAG: hypothetical protein KA984_00815 [Candidatus Cloacimonetes bacterium]|nr:hypothetical protein [Candidatus Cloacimonadota bacterium]